MSWFNHKPKVREHNRLTPYTTSPMAEQQLKETKIKVRPKEDKEPKKK